MADYESRNQDNSSEWPLNNGIFLSIIQYYKVNPTIDLFASRNYCKVKRFIAWQPDPEAIEVDTFMQYFDDELFYTFPPFNLMFDLLPLECMKVFHAGVCKPGK